MTMIRQFVEIFLAEVETFCWIRIVESQGEQMQLRDPVPAVLVLLERVEVATPLLQVLSNVTGVVPYQS